jgi:hypothetical protein
LCGCQFRLTPPLLYSLVKSVDAEQTIVEIECLERNLANTRPLQSSDLLAANRKHDEMHAHSPWFRLWRSLEPTRKKRSGEFVASMS